MLFALVQCESTDRLRTCVTRSSVCVCVSALSSMSVIDAVASVKKKPGSLAAHVNSQIQNMIEANSR